MACIYKCGHTFCVVDALTHRLMIKVMALNKQWVWWIKKRRGLSGSCEMGLGSYSNILGNL